MSKFNPLALITNKNQICIDPVKTKTQSNQFGFLGF